MKSFEYTITEEVGIHARPAGLLSKEAAKFKECTIKVWKGEKSAEPKRLIQLMALGVKHGDTITVTVEGEDEEAVFEHMKKYFEENL